MTTESKIKLANITISVITGTVGVVAVWFIIFLTTSTFNLTVFAEKTSEFFITLILVAIAIVFCSAFLNMSLNLSLIADARIKELNVKSEKLNNKVFLYFGIGLAVLISLLFVGDKLSREQEKTRLVFECEDLISRYPKSIEEISVSLKDSSKTKNIPTILKFLSSQKIDYRDISIITQTEFNGQVTFLHITTNSSDNDFAKPYYNSSFYRCNEIDSKYLSDVFKSKNKKPFVWSEKDDHYLYFPIFTDKESYVLYLSKASRYGSFGS